MTKDQLMEIKEKALRNLKMATENNNKSRIENYKDQLKRIDEKLNEIENNNGLKGLKEFLNDWSNNVKNWYINNANKIINGDITYKELKGSLNQKDYNIVNNLIYTIRFEKGKNINKILNFIDKSAEQKEINFINQVTKLVGDIVNCNNLRISKKDGIDGIIIGELGSVKIETIFAGGYNIQKLHFRVLIKKW